MTRALIAGVDSDEIADLARAARPLLGTSCSYMALEVPPGSTRVEVTLSPRIPGTRS